MTELFTVSFTTKTAVTRVTRKSPRSRKVVERVEQVTSVTIDALTREKAMAYAQNDDFQMVPFDPTKKLTAKGSGRDNAIGNGTVMRPVANGVRTGEASIVMSGKGKSVVANAARTGNLGAALSA